MNQVTLVVSRSRSLFNRVAKALPRSELTLLRVPPELEGGLAAALADPRTALVFLDMELKKPPAPDLLDAIRDIDDGIPVIGITRGPGSIREGIDFILRGGSNYLSRPTDAEIRFPALEALAHHDQFVDRVPGFETNLEQVSRLGRLVTRDPVMRDVLQQLDQLSRLPTTTLLIGPTGTGKDLCAEALHFEGSRREGLFVVVNCGAVPASASVADAVIELRGAPGVSLDPAIGRPGVRARVKHGVTVYLDKIETLSSMAQTCLFPLLDEGRIDILGLPDDIDPPPFARVVASTTADPAALLRSGELREDFYYRIARYEIRLPPLRERLVDIPVLASRFLRDSVVARQRGVARVSNRAMENLLGLPWPGNVRELFNRIERGVLHTRGPTLRHVPL